MSDLIVAKSHNAHTNLQYFGSSGETLVLPSSEMSSEKALKQNTSSETPYVGEEGIPVMAETVVEGSAIDSFDDP